MAKKLRIEKELQEKREAAELIPDSADKRLTRKKIRKINYKERDAYPETFMIGYEKKKVPKKEKE